MQPDKLMSPVDDEQLIEPVPYEFGLSRRGFVQILSAGLVISVSAGRVFAQRAGGGGRSANASPGRIHIGKDGQITVLSGKVEGGQGARAELTLAAAEELRVSPGQIQMLLADTNVVPDDGMTAGSRSTPSTVPAVRQAAAAARELLVQLACTRWKVEPGSVTVQEGKITGPDQHTLTYAELAQSDDLAKIFEKEKPAGVTLTPVKDWKTMGQPLGRPNRRDLATGRHQFPSDQTRPGMLYGKVLRPPSFGAKLVSVDVEAVKAMSDVKLIQDGSFVGVAAPTSHRARQALDMLTEKAQWETVPHPASNELFDYLRTHVHGSEPKLVFPDQAASASKVLKATYTVAYVQHAPLEPRTALAEWDGEELTVWTGTQNPFGYKAELARAFHMPIEKVRVVVPDFGAAFGGKHTGEAAVEAARLARGAGKPVLLRWTREEEFTWAYFRPAGVIDIVATMGDGGKLTSWHQVNINSGPSAIDTPYKTGLARSQHLTADAPLRQGSYRALAATANTFARECAMDELAEAAGVDPLEFRLAHLENPRLKGVLEEAARRFNWNERVKRQDSDRGVGLACGTEKGSYVAACVEIGLDRLQNRIKVRKVCQVFECGAIVNPENLLTQVQGAIVMGLGPALREQMRFENGKMGNAKFDRYHVPRFSDLPELDIHLLNRPDLPSVGAGETPIIAVAPAIANALFHATGKRVRQMPITFPSP